MLLGAQDEEKMAEREGESGEMGDDEEELMATVKANVNVIVSGIFQALEHANPHSHTHTHIHPPIHAHTGSGSERKREAKWQPHLQLGKYRVYVMLAAQQLPLAACTIYVAYLSTTQTIPNAFLISPAYCHPPPLPLPRIHPSLQPI